MEVNPFGPERRKPDPGTLSGRVKRVVLGKPRDLSDRRVFHHLSLIAFLAWVGLGADGLSSSAYGPEEAFKNLGSHTSLAVLLALMTGGTVVLISLAYSRLIEEFPHGGGGYYVATRLLGERAGVVSGSALLVDYVLTITVSVAAAGDALFSLAPAWRGLALPVEVGFIVILTMLNLRGVRESVMVLAPIFVVFLLTHAALIGGGILAHASQVPAISHEVQTGLRDGVGSLGLLGMALLLLRAFSLGGGTYTGIEAVSNGLPIMREPRVATARRTMAYMAISLSLTASGLLLCYLLWHVQAQPGETMNASLVETMTSRYAWGPAFKLVTLVSEGALLVVAAQAGFLDGPRVLANMAADSWVPHRFAALSQRLTTSAGIVLMGATALAALLYTRGSVAHLVVMYSINVFATFSMSMFGMMRFWWANRRTRQHAWRRLALFVSGFVLCATILVITVFEKFGQGGWVTVVATGAVVALCLAIKRHYAQVTATLRQLHAELENLPPVTTAHLTFDPSKPTAVVLVGSYGGLGIHTVLNVFRAFPGYFKNLEFISVAPVDASAFRSAETLAECRHETEEALRRYVELAQSLGVPARSRGGAGTDVVDELERLCIAASQELPRCTFFAGQVIFRRDTWWRRLLHNQTAFDVQSRLQWEGLSMQILPARLRGA